MVQLLNPEPMKKGTAKTIRVTITFSETNGPNLNLASEILFSLSDTAASTRHFQKTMEDAVITDSGAITGNVVAFTILPEDVASLAAGKYYLELRYTIAGLPDVPYDGWLLLEESNND